MIVCIETAGAMWELVKYVLKLSCNVIKRLEFMESSRSLTEKGEFAKNAESDVYLCFRFKIHFRNHVSQLTAPKICGWGTIYNEPN